MHHERPVTEVLEVQNENASLLAFLPPFDKALGTRNICIAGLAFSWLLSISSLFLVIVVLVPDISVLQDFPFQSTPIQSFRKPYLWLSTF